MASPTLAITEQFFTAHRLADDPVACVWHDQHCHLVYLRLQDERYYWVVRIERQQDGSFTATWGFHSPHADVYAVIYSQRSIPAEISAVLSMSATDQREKGVLLGRVALREHRWYHHSSLPDCLDFETKLKRLLDELPADKVHSLPGDCEVCIQVAYYEYQGCPGGWHLEPSILKQLAVLGVSLDIDLYVSGPPLPG